MQTLQYLQFLWMDRGYMLEGYHSHLPLGWSDLATFATTDAVILTWTVEILKYIHDLFLVTVQDV